MSYSPITDFLSLLRRTPRGDRLAQMPGLDYVIAAMARMQMFTLWTGATAPLTSQASTVWLKPAQPSWSAEGGVFLWNGVTDQFEPATPALWYALLSISFAPYVFQLVTAAAAQVQQNATMAVINRASPAATTLTLPVIGQRTGRALQIADMSTAIGGEHDITLQPNVADVGATIMRAATWEIVSTPDQLAGVTLYPSTDLNAWVIAP